MSYPSEYYDDIVVHSYSANIKTQTLEHEASIDYNIDPKNIANQFHIYQIKANL
ncbi:hypothetical protein [Pseudoalteromonas sp. NBT06-2]|uniref:hypothetical protein n=1 Tax=Pseudoalteromonas sp. NBT06-2 TaxID=2025950 RepID=UPI00148311FA|nr:hypothetical protein [Pseudoalteromonas sp. NBT06-2]